MLGALVRPIARVALSGIFIGSGYRAARDPAPFAKRSARVGLPESELGVRANGAAMVLGGAALAVGFKPRLAALGLLASLGVTTYSGHPFWLEESDETRVQQQTQFLKNLGLAGGLLLVLSSPSRAARRRRRRQPDSKAGAAA